MHVTSRPVEGWRKSAIVLIVLIWALVLGLFAALGLSIRISGSLNRNTVLFAGTCGTAKQLTSALSLVINVVSTTILFSSGFFLTLLVCPTREDVDKAHVRSRYLDVGVNGLHNLRLLPRSRTVLWLLLASASLPLHTLLNASVYSTDSTVNFLRVMASEAWLQRTPYYLPGIGLNAYPESDAYGDNAARRRELTYIAQNAPRWEALDGAACFAAYSRASGVRDRRHLVVLVTNSTVQGLWNTTAVWQYSYREVSFSSLWAQRVCRGQPQGRGDSRCDADESFFPAPARSLLAFDRVAGPPPPGANWTIRWEGSDTLFLRPEYRRLLGGYCLSEPWAERCGSRVNNALLLAACCFALAVAVLCTVALRLLWHERLLATTGDAVESFLARPDPNTAGMCALGARDFASKKPGSLEDATTLWAPEPRTWVVRKIFCGEAIPKGPWRLAYWTGGLLWFVGVVCWAVLLKDFPWAESKFGLSPANPQRSFYQEFSNQTVASSLNQHLVGAAVFASLPQLVASLFYLVLIAFLTRMASAREWGHMAAGHQPLRVTSPKGGQLEAHIFQMPLLWAVLTQVWFIFLHFLISQSIYVFVEDHADWHGNPSHRTVGAGASMKAMLSTLMVSLSTMALPMAVAKLKMPAQTVVAGTCSAAISAACQPTSSEENAASHAERVRGVGSTSASGVPGGLPVDDITGTRAQRRLRWGVLPGERQVQLDDGNWETAGHLSFGTGDEEVREVVNGAWYGG